MRKIYVLLHDAQQLFRQALAALNNNPVSPKRSTTLLYPTALYTESKPELSKSNLSQMQMFTHNSSTKTLSVFNRWMMISIVALLSLFSSLESTAQTERLLPLGDGSFSNGASLSANGWSSSNSANNPWVVGSLYTTGSAPFAGASAYISENGGTTSTYTPTNNATNFFWRDITIPAGEGIITLSFNWRQQGESSWDIWQVYYGPTSITPVGVTTHPGSGTTTIPPALTGATVVGAGSLVTGVQTFTASLPASLAGTTFRLFFSWKNETGGTQPPAAIDNISVTSALPSTFTATSLGGLWSSPATWVGGVVPPAGNDVTIPAGSIVTVDQLTSYRNLDISGTVQWNGSSNAMTLSGNLTVNSGAVFLPYTTGQTGQTVNIAGNFTNNGYANCALSSTLINFNGAGSTLSGTGTFQGNGTDGIIRTLAFQNTGSNSISTSQNIITTSGFTHTAGSLNTGGKLKIDNAVDIYGLPLNLRVANLAVTTAGTLYNAAPVVFGAAVIQYASGVAASANSRYVSGNNVYLCTTAGTFNATPPTSTTPAATFATSGPTLLYIGQVGQLGLPFQVTAVTVGTQYAYNGNLYTCTVAGTPTAVTAPTHTSGAVASGTATFLYAGTAATATVNYDATSQSVRSLTLTSAGSGYSAAPAIVFGLGVAGGTGSGAAATAVFIQQVTGATSSLTQKSGGAATISGGITINSDQGTSVATANTQATSGVGAISTTSGGVNYTVAPTVGFALPPALNLITDQGSGYTTAPTVTVTGGNLVSGTALTTSNFTITVNNGKVVSVYLNTGTSATYSTLPTLSLTASPGVTATLAFPAGCLPAATANIGANGQITSFTITNPGFGYQAAPTVGFGATSGTANGGTFTTAATTPTARIALYNLTLNFFTPAASAVVSADDAAIPANRKINTLSLAGNGNGLTLSAGNLTLYGTSPLSLTASASVPGNILDLGGSNLLFTWSAYAGTTATFGTTNTYIKNGSITLTGKGGASTFNYPFAGTFTWFAGSTPTTVTTGSTVTKVTVTETAAPSGTGSIGTRAYLVNTNGGTTGLNPTVAMNYNTIDALPSGNNATDLFISQSAALSGPWSPRTVSSGSGTLGTSGTRTTATVAPGPIAPTGLDYFAWTNVTLDATNITAQPATCVASAHIVSADVATSIGTITGVTINYNNGTAAGPLAMTNTAGNTWQFTIPAASPASTTVSWSFTATNSAGISKTFAGVSYTDADSTGLTGTITASVNPVCAGTPSVLTAAFVKTATAAIGTATTLTGATSQPTAFNNRFSSYRMQLLYTAAELQAAGLGAGNITSIAFNTTTLGDGSTNAAFTVKMGTTALTAFTDFVATTSFTTVFPAATYTHAVGVNTINFSTPYNWDGVSNIVVEVSHNGANSTNNAITYYTTTAANTLAYSINGATTGTPTNQRLNIVFTGNAAPAISNITWNDGASNVATGNPYTVSSPSATTTYTVSGTTTAGCIFTSTPLTLTVNALPSAPLNTGAFPSVQCGLGVPSGFVTGASTGQYRWYNVPTGGTAIAGETNGSLSTYVISTTTTFYIAINDGNCEGPRTSVQAFVVPADSITAQANSSATPAEVCFNSTIDLSVVQTPVNPNTYVYTWTCTSGNVATSGLTTSYDAGTAGTVSVTPTAPGTYTYHVSAVDAGAGCTNSSDVIITVRALPVIYTPTAVPATICAGSSSTITATTNAISAGIASSIGAATTLTPAAGQPTAFNNRWPSYRMQLLYTAAELTAAGLTPGNITSMAFNTTTLGDAATNGNFRVKIGNTGLTAFTAFVDTTTGFTNVFNPKTYTHTASGLQTISFDAPFNWDGTSNIVVQVCMLGADITNNAQTYYTATAGNTIAYTATAETNAATLGTSRLNIIFGGQVMAQGAGSLSWTWDNGAGTGNAVPVSPSTTTTYTVTGSDGTCADTALVTVNVNALPAAPTANDDFQCGTLVPTAFVSSGSLSPSFNWYSAETGGTPIQTGTTGVVGQNGFYNSPISATTTFYVSELSAEGCESAPRTPVSVTVITPDSITVTATNTSICLGGTTDISFSYTVEFNNFTVDSITAVPLAGSGITAAGAGTDYAEITFNGSNGSVPFTVAPTAAGTYVYTIKAVDGPCVSFNSVSVTVHPLPSITSFTATPGTICEGGTITLTAKSVPSGTGTAALGAGAGTSSSSGTPFYGGWGGTKVQYIYTAAELTAAGIVAGNITSLGLNVTAAGATTYNGFAISIGSTSQSTFATANALTSVTQVYTGPLANSGYQTTVGLNTFNFIAPFLWDGSSNIVVSICYSNATTSNPASTVQTDTYAGNIAMYIYADSQTPSTVCGATTTIPASGGSSTSTLRPKTTFGGQVGINQTASYTWEFNPGAISGGTTGIATTTASTAISAYTATATSSFGCSSITAPVSVTVNPLPATPIATASTQCGLAVPTASVSGQGGTFKWYDAATAGTLLQTGGTTYTGTISATDTFYVSETSAAGCEGPRAMVIATVTAPPTLVITPATGTTFCQGGSVVLNAATGSDPSYVNFTLWSTVPASGAGLNATSGASVTATPTVAGTYTITVLANDGLPNGCSNSASISITMNANPVIDSVVATPATICVGGSSILAAYSSSQAAGPSGLPATYCVPDVSGGGGSSPITSVVFGTINHTAISQVTPWYDIYPLSTTVTAGQTYPLTVTSGAASIAAVWIDYNRDGVFSTTEFQQLWTSASSGTINITIPMSAVAGETAMRIRTRGTGSSNGSGDACTSFFSGTVQDYSINIIGTVSQNNNYTYSWNAGAVLGNNVTVNPTVTTAYTVTVTNPFLTPACSTTALVPVTVTVQAVAANATATASAICAGGSSTISANATGGGPFTYSWSDGTATVYPTTASITVNPASTTTYTVTVTDACSQTTTSSKEIVVNPIPTISINEATATICEPAVYALTTTTSAGSPAYQWISGSTDISGQTAATYTAAATGTYKVKVTDGVTGCFNTSATVGVTINPQPVVASITPASATVCSGGSVSLTVSGGTTGGAGTVVLGTGTTSTTAATTTSALGPNPFQSYYGGTKQQMLVLASELSGLGLTAGTPLNSIAFTLNAVESRTLQNYVVKLQHTSLTAFANTTFVSGGFTVVRTAADYAPVNGLNTIPFTSNFVWNGSSNLLVEVNFSNNDGGGSGTNTALYSTTAFTSSLFYRVDNNTATTVDAATTATASYSVRNNIVFGYNSLQQPTYSWLADPTLSTTTGATTVATPINTTTYTAVATNSFGCTRQQTVTITANACSPVWTGATSTNWNTASNWSSNVVPSIIENVTIGTAGTGFYPVLTANQTVGGTLTMASGTSITIGSNTLTLNGGVTPISAGVLVGSATSNLSVAGTAPLKFASGAGATLKNLTVTSGTTTLTSALDITGGTGGINSGTFGTVTVANGATLASAGFLTFKSNASGTARLASGNVTGDVTVERFIPANAKRAYRMLSVPTKGGQKIKAAWQEGGTNANFNPKPGFGTVITSNVGPSATMIANGFDQYSTSTSMQRWNTATGAWENITATQGTGNTGNIESLRGYSIYIRGDRTQLNTGTTTTSTTLRTTGTLYIGDQAPISIPANKFEMVGNTYVSAIDFAALTRSNINGTLYLWDPKLPQSNGTLGGYVSFVAITGYAPSLTTGSYTTANSVIESGQSFFVATGANPGTLTLTESAKVIGSRSDVFRPSTAPKKLKANLYVVAADNSTLMADANVSVFDNPYSNAVDGDDGLKLSNAGENLAIFRDNKNLVVEGRQPVAEFDTTYFNMWNMSAARQYRLELVAEQMDIPGLSAYLVDNYLGTTTPLNMSGSITYNFGISSSAPLSSATNRFKVVYRQVQLAPLPVTFVSISANKLGAAVKVDWKVAAERGIVRYEVERSADGSRFINAGNVTATGNSSLDLTYSWMDATPLSGTNFYRIKSIGVAGDVKYTNIAKVTFGDVKPSYTIAPNPVEGSTVNLQFKNRVAGRYNVRLLSNAGQVIFTTIAEHAGGNSTQLISLPATIARGAYQIEIIAPDKTTEVQNLFINTTK